MTNLWVCSADVNFSFVNGRRHIFYLLLRVFLLKKNRNPGSTPDLDPDFSYRFFSPLPTKYRLLLYNANIKPLFTYCCTVWSNCSQTNFDELFKLYSPRDARSYDNFGWSTVQAHFGLNTSTLPEQKHYTAYRNPELKQWEHSFIPLLKN